MDEDEARISDWIVVGRCVTIIMTWGLFILHDCCIFLVISSN